MKIFNSYLFPFAKYPAVRIALLFAAGIIIDHYLTSTLWTWIACLAFFLTLFLGMELIHSCSLQPGYYRLSITMYLVSIILLGCFRHALLHHRKSTPAQQLLCSYQWKKVQFSGNIYRIKRVTSGNTQLDVKIDTTILSDSIPWSNTYPIRTFLNTRESVPPKGLKLGNRISFIATIYPLEEKRNPYEFDYKGYLAFKNIYTQAGIDSIITITPSQDFFSWPVLRQKVLDLIDHNFSGKTASLSKALLLGYKDDLNKGEKIAFARAGLSHIMAVSGLHVGFILVPFWLLIPFFWTFLYGRQIGLAVLISLLYIYAGLTGFSASVIRASIAGGFITYGRLFYKIRDSRNLMALAALLILLFNPDALFDVGFQLSFGAVYIILLTLPVIQCRLLPWIRFRWYGQPVLVVIVSLIVQIGLFPLLGFYFGEFSLSGPFINALVIPFLGFIVPYSLILLPVSAMFSMTGYWLNLPNRLFLEFLQWLVVHTAAWDNSWIQIHIQDPMIFLIWIAAIFFIASLNIPRYRWKCVIILLLLLCIQQEINIYQSLRKPELKITIFDVGQGDAALITTPLGRHFLVDTGRWEPGYNSAKKIILPHLKAIGIDKLDALFLSHPHADHIGGINELINSIPIDTIYNSGFHYHSIMYKTYIQKASEKNIPVVSLKAGDMVNLDPSMPIFVYGPQPFSENNDPNEHCLILEFIYGSKEFLFEGDAGKKQERRLIENFGDLINTDFLKVAHHGSRTSSTTAFLDIATPDISIVSVALHNHFGHPNTEAILHLYKTGTKLYFTSLNRALLFSSDGSSIRRLYW